MSLISWLKNVFSSQPEEAHKAPLGRNDECWCGSGKKYKRCHLKDDAAKNFEEAHAARVASQRTGQGSRRRPTPAPEREPVRR